MTGKEHTAFAFPEHFMFGTATSATQVEGQCEGTDWAEFSRRPGRIRNGDTPTVACDQWGRWMSDFAILRKLGLNAHRFSIEWARVEPSPGKFDHTAIDRYRAMLGALLDAGIAPLVTLHHFSIPRWLSERRGLLSGDLTERLTGYTVEVVRRSKTSVAGGSRSTSRASS